MVSEGQYYYDNNGQPQLVDNSGSNLRRQFEQALAENQALRQELDKNLEEKRAETVTAALEKAGLAAGVAKFVPAEDAAEPARLESWIKENSALLSRVQGDDDSSNDEGASNVSEAKAKNIQKMAALNSGGANNTVDLDALHERMRDPNLSETDFNNLINQYR